MVVTREESPREEYPGRETGREDQPTEKGDNLYSKKGKQYTRTGLMLQSLAVPGMGLSRLTGKPHWLRAVAGFGCIAASISTNKQAIATYNSIETTSGFDAKVELYNTSISQDNLSELFAWTALGVWITDIIWTFVRTSDLPLTSAARDRGGISLGGGMDLLTYTPTFGLKYTFKIKP